MEFDSILDHPAISGRYLFPQARYVADPFVVRVVGAQLNCCLRRSNSSAFTMIYFHGNGEAVADYVPWLADEFAALGLNSLFVEYRAYGRSTGHAQLVSMLGDGEAALKAAGVDPKRAIAFGRSLGSLYAIELARRQPALAGLVLESGIADLTERLLAYADLDGTSITAAEVAAEVHRHFNHEAKLSGYRNPLLVMHAEQDCLVDVSHAERNYQWCAGKWKRLLRLPNGNHNSILVANCIEYFEALRDFVRLVTR